MKRTKLIIFFILLSLTFTSCASNKPKKLNKENIQDGNLSKKEDFSKYDIEADINHQSIKEDESLTNVNNQFKDFLSERNLELSIQSVDLNKYEIIKKFNSMPSSELNIELVYNKYLMPYDYFAFTSDKVKIYASPSTKGNVLGTASIYDKAKLINQVKGEYLKDKDSNSWYAITWQDKNGEYFYGFVPDGTGLVRSFRFDTMYQSLLNFEKQLRGNRYGYISNYKDKNGSPPLLNGKGFDKYGMQAYQSAPAYPNLNNKYDFRYIPDGMVVFITGETKEFYKVNIPDYENGYWIPKQYVSFDDNLDNLAKAVVVDTTNQNEGVFEKRGNNWYLVSYTLATTGVKEKHKFETPIGKFKVLDKKERFLYLDDKTKEVSGYAPYAVRFTGGAYIHGVPVEFIKKDGENIDPGIKEYLATIGTVPRSHKCVRNYSSHAKFLYNWADSNDTAVIVIK